MPIRALLFDFDGLIVDTEWPEVEVWTAIYREHGFEFPDSVWKGVIGRGPEQEAVRAEHLLAEWTGKPAADLEAAYQARRMDVILAQPVLPGVTSLLESAKAAGLTIAAVSSSRRSWVEGHLQRLDLWSYFTRSFCNDDVKNTKPAPDLYLLALATLGVTADEAIVFEDSPNGIAAARAAGIQVIAIPNRLTAQLDLTQATQILESLEDYKPTW